MRILGIESSCDETAAAIVDDGRKVLSSVIASQAEEHRQYGGVVPELASRRHSENILPVVQETLRSANLCIEDVDGIAVTYTPGLIGALLVGVSFAKGLAMMTGKPLIPVHHTEGHAAANYLAHRELAPPYLALIASGGHTQIVEVLDYTTFRAVGRTRDDAAGECFDKCARAMGLPYPGGIQIEQAARLGDPKSFRLPETKVDGNPFDFSFSGLKTYIVNLIHNMKQRGEAIPVHDLAAALQQKIANTLTKKTIAAAKALGYQSIAISGGVSANSGVRESLMTACEAEGFSLSMPPISLCGDNGAMIAAQGYYNFCAGYTADETLQAVASKEMRHQC